MIASTARDVSAVFYALPESLLLRAVETSSFGLSLADAKEPDLPLSYVNAAFQAMTGYGPEETIGRNCRYLQGPETDKGVVAQISQAIRTETSGSFLLLNYRKDGTRFWNRFQLSPVHDEAGALSAYLGMQVDITADVEQTGLENERQKLETLGRMAGGVAHELNNALQPIRLFAEVLDETPEIEERIKQRCTAGILEHVKFAKDIVGQILAFARRDNSSDQDHEALDLIAEAVDFAFEYVPSSITLERHGFEAEGPLRGATVKLNRTALLQVMSNLFMNAAHATGDKGHIVVDLAPAWKEPPGSDAEQPKRDFLSITVTDNGCGIAPESLKHIFEPFYTTKPAGQGVGLGLSSIYGIVERWGGRIEASSTLGEGTTFRILIPVTRKT